MKPRAVLWFVIAIALGACALALFPGWDRVANLLAQDANADLGRPVHGVVVDAESGLPIAGARITCVNTKRMTFSTRTWTDKARSNASGDFTVQGSADDGDNVSGIEVMAPGYGPSSQPALFGERMTIKLWPIRRAG